MFAKLLVLNGRCIKNMQATNMLGSLQSFNKFQHQTVEFQLNCFMVTDCINLTFSSYECIIRSSCCKVHTFF